MVIIAPWVAVAFTIFLILNIVWNAARSSYGSSYARPKKHERAWQALKQRQDARQAEALRSFFRRIFYRSAR